MFFDIKNWKKEDEWKMQEDRFNGNQKMVLISKRDYPSKANRASS